MKVQNDPLIVLPTVGEQARENLYAAGYESVEDVRDASKDELMEVPYIGEGKATFLVKYLEQ